MKLDAYIRVSQVRGRTGPSFISPAQQRDRILAWMKAFGYEVGEVFEELDQSGARKDRPMLMAAVERVESGHSDGIVVAKLDRFGRSLVDGLQLIDRIQDAGGTFASVQDGFDLRTDTGRLVLRIMLSMAEYELERVRSNWHDAKARAVMRGVHPSARPPFGYRREGRGGPLFVDDRNGPLVTALFRRRVELRESYSQLARWLGGEGARTSAGRALWSLRGVKDIIRNRVYLGIAYAGATENPDAHPALVDYETWRAAQRTGQQTIPRSEHPSPLSGLMRCAGCRYVMRAERRVRAGDEVWIFSCRSTQGANAWHCRNPARVVMTDAHQEAIAETFLQRLPAFVARSRQTTPRLEEAAQAADDARSAFISWRDNIRLQTRLGMDAYVDGLEQRQQALSIALAELAREEGKADARALPTDLADLRTQWPSLTSPEQRTLMRAAIVCVLVRAGKATESLDERLRIVWRGSTLALPRKGHVAWTPEPADFRDLDGEAHVCRVTLPEDGLPCSAYRA
jgi:DNA invertase Pin-like site-specific DNA recombinase